MSLSFIVKWSLIFVFINIHCNKKTILIKIKIPQIVNVCVCINISKIQIDFYYIFFFLNFGSVCRYVQEYGIMYHRIFSTYKYIIINAYLTCTSLYFIIFFINSVNENFAYHWLKGNKINGRWSQNKLISRPNAVFLKAWILVGLYQVCCLTWYW